MINAVIRASTNQRLVMVVLTLALVAFGIKTLPSVTLDAFPDVTNVQVQVATEAPGLGPEEVERFVTVPLELGLTGIPGVTEMRSLNRNGLSLITVVFRDDVDTYFARQLVLERIIEVRGNLPAGVVPVLGPVSTGLGEIYQYSLEKPDDGDRALTEAELMERRTVQEWVVRPLLRSIPGIADVNSLGGLVRQYQVLPNPDRLRHYRISVNELVQRLEQNNGNTGGGILPHGSDQYLIRGVGLIDDISDIANIIVKEISGTPIYMRDVAEVKIGHEVRYGTLIKDGKTEAVGGIVMMLKGGNAKQITGEIKKKVEQINAQNLLPGGLRIKPFYDRSFIVDGSISTMIGVITKALLLKTLVLFLLMGEIRSCLIISNTLIVAPLMTFIAMKYLGMSANLMSLTGLTIAIGLITDGAICVVENVYSRLGHGRPQTLQDRLRMVVAASGEVGVPVMFGIAVMILVLVPLLALEGMEGKLFKPLAITLALGLVASLFLALTITPALCAYFLKGGAEEDTRLMRWIRRPYTPMLQWAIAHPKKVVGITVASFFGSLLLIPLLGKAFIPIMQEGAIVPGLIRFANISFNETVRVEREAMQRIMSVPGIAGAMGRVGRGDSPADPQMPNESDPIVNMVDRSQWPDGWTQSDFENAIREKLKDLPGVDLMISQPVQQRVDELLSGVRAQIVVKIFGEDMDVLRDKADRIATVLRTVQGIKDLRVELVGGQQYYTITIDRQAIARQGINVSDVNTIIETALAGKVATFVFEGQRRFAAVVRFPAEFRESEDAIGSILVPTLNGATVPLKSIADIRAVDGPTQISRENRQRRMFIGVNIANRDLGSFVKEAQEKIASRVDLPEGYSIVWGGQYENMQRAMGTLAVIIPIVILAILFLLFMLYGSLKYAVLVISVLPQASIGGILGLFVTGEYLSVPASIGFIVLWGISVINGVVLVAHFLHLKEEGYPLDKVIYEGSQHRLRPVLMTAALTNIGLVPMLLTTGLGSEVQRPLATVVVFGVITATFLTMLFVPALFKLFESGTGARREAAPVAAPLPRAATPAP
jgi:cobalt-zinc-cadmium resistance protein CzcA